jgi:hypothetical protein
MLTGCQQAPETLLTVNFSQDQPLKYKFASSRDIAVDWAAGSEKARSGKSVVNKSSESVEFVMVYEAVDVNPYGLSKIKATCESVKVSRKGKARTSGRDAVRSLEGKSFTITVDPVGNIEDYSELRELIHKAGEKTFSESQRGRIKNPDMVGDFVATQWFLWDAVSSIENPSEGMAAGQSWESKLMTPSPLPIRQARRVTYTLDEFRQSERGLLAIISEQFGPADSAPESWPVPYKGTYRIKGQFGLLSNYKLLKLDGQGQEVFNVDKGRIDFYDQQYRMKFRSSLPMGLARPEITIEQNLSMHLLEK